MAAGIEEKVLEYRQSKQGSVQVSQLIGGPNVEGEYLRNTSLDLGPEK